MIDNELRENERKPADSATVIIVLICTIITIVFPILAIVTNSLGMILLKKGFRKYCALLLAFSLATVAYIWIPDSSMDLYRHHYDIGLLSGFNVERLGKFIATNLEPFQYFFKYIVGQTGDYNLLQFVVIMIGYSELFWLICDITELKKCTRPVFILLFIYAFSIIRFIDFASGLWFNLSVITIALGVYLEFFRKTKRIQYVLYLSAACFHIGTLYAIVLILLLSKIKVFKKTRLSTMLVVFLAMLSFGGIVLLANNLFGSDFPLVRVLNKMYDGYFVNGAQFDDLHTGWSLYLAIANISLCFILALWHYKKIRTMRDYDSLIIYLAISIVATIFGAGVFIRFRTLLVILSLPLVISCLQEAKNRGLRLSLVVVVLFLSSVQLHRSYVQAQSAGLVQRINSSLTSSVFNLRNGN